MVDPTLTVEHLVEFLMSPVDVGGTGGPCPEQNVHPWIRKAAGALKDAEKIGIELDRALCIEAILRCVPESAHNRKGEGELQGEVERAVNSIMDRGESAVESIPSADRLPLETLEKFAGGVEPLEHAPATGDAVITEVINTLFEPDEQVCIGGHRARAKTMLAGFWCKFPANHHHWPGSHKHSQFIVPQPATAARGMTSAGEPSGRCNDMFQAPHRYVVVEFDGIPDKGLQVRLHTRLNETFPLVMMVDSGGKSIHGWYFVQGAELPLIHKFMELAQRLGADKATYTKCQWVRLPGGIREPKEGESGTKPQPLLYLRDPREILMDTDQVTAAIDAMNVELGAAVVTKPAKKPKSNLQVHPRPASEPAPTEVLPPRTAPAPSPTLGALQPRTVRGFKIIGVEPAVADEFKKQLDKFFDQVLEHCCYVDDSTGGRWVMAIPGQKIFDLRNPMLFSTRMRCEASRSGVHVPKGALLDGTAPEDAYRLHVAQSRTVRYAGRIGGRLPGYRPADGRPGSAGGGDKPVYVTEGPNLIAPVPGDWSVIRAMITNMLGHEPLQVESFFLYLRAHIRAVLADEHVNQPFMIFVGPAGCGKTFTQDHIMAPIAGGKSCDPTTVITGASRFTGTMAEADILSISDSSEQPTAEQRRAREDGIKRMVSSLGLEVEHKGRDSVHLVPIQMHVMSANYDMLQTLPSAGVESVSGKLLALDCELHPMPMPTHTPELRAAFARRIQDELPAFVHFLQNEFEPPRELLDDRWTVRPAIADKLRIADATQDGPAIQLLHQMVEHCAPTPGATKSGRAMDRTEILTATEIVQRAARNSGGTAKLPGVVWTGRLLRGLAGHKLRSGEDIVPGIVLVSKRIGPRGRTDAYQIDWDVLAKSVSGE